MNSARQLLLALCMAIVAVSAADAKPRTRSVMEKLAIRTLTKQAKTHRAPRKGPLKTLHTSERYAVFGYDAGGFVIIGADDLLPEVIGYSDSRFNVNTKNAGFRCWMQMVDDATSQILESGVAHIPTKPDITQFPPYVVEMLTSKWGQEEPYNNMCPYGTDSGTAHWQDYSGGDGRCLTGCVATALAQILNYHQYPPKGQNTASVVVNGTNYALDFDTIYFDWANMLDEYIMPYTEEQGHAVAQLMYACGVASNMSYATDGSGTYTQNAYNGLINNFGFSPDTVKTYSRDRKMSSKEWMGIIYKELSENRPVFYTGADMRIFAGHAFVFDGYDEDGLVHVNWGWYGDEDGYYDIDLLDPRTYKFSAQQDMIIGLEGLKPTLYADTLMVEQPGTLADRIPADRRLLTDTLKISGRLNSTDLRLLRLMAGCDSLGKSTRGHLEVLDLSEAHFLSGGEPYLRVDSTDYSTKDNTLTELLFNKCRKLKRVILPASLQMVEPRSFNNCSRLESVEVPQQATDNYVYHEGAFLSTDSTELICVVPTKNTEYTIPSTVTVVRPLAFAGIDRLKRVNVPAAVDSIGERAFSDIALRQLRIYSFTPPVAGQDCFKNISKNCVLYVPAGSKNEYRNAEQWKNFFDGVNRDPNVAEHGTGIKVRNAIRDYGDANPVFGYLITGEHVVGTPVISCEANELSPAGHYLIHIEPGTITGDLINFIDGYLIVAPAPLTVKAENAERTMHAEDPEFTLTYEGFKNGENEDVLIKKPTATSTAYFDSPEGDYDIIVEGGEAQNYEFRYVPGTLTVKGENTAIRQLPTDEENAYSIYSTAGQLIRSNATSTLGLPKGIYIVNGKRIVVK